MKMKGIYTPLVTPFDGDLIDYGAFRKLIEFQISSGIDGLIVLGTTGESATISAAERDELIAFSVEAVGKRVPLFVGSGCNCTEIAKRYSERAQALGADGILVVTPYYNKCTQAGLVRHYSEICSVTDLPLVPYNVPQRTGMTILPDTAIEISRLKNFIAFKDADNDFKHLSKFAALFGERLMCGNDFFNSQALGEGAGGCISAVANLIPRQMKEIYNAAAEGNNQLCAALENRLMPLINALYCEINPIPLKYALSKVGLIKNQLRLPLTSLEQSNRATVDALLTNIAF